MSKDIRVPALGESVTEATVAKWFKAVGDAVKADEPMVERVHFGSLLSSISPVSTCVPRFQVTLTF